MAIEARIFSDLNKTRIFGQRRSSKHSLALLDAIQNRDIKSIGNSELKSKISLNELLHVIRDLQTPNTSI